MKQTIAALLALGVLATGCGVASSAGGATDAPAAGDAAGTRPSDDTMRETAQSLLGTAEADLADDIRVGRRGGEQMALTEDYVIGRYTVELDDDGTGTFRVTAVTVEMEDGPETFSA